MTATTPIAADTADRRFVRRAMKAPLLSQEREVELATRWREKGDEAALHELTTAYLRLVVSVASRFKAYGLAMNDLIQEGTVGLMQAAGRFEPERGVRFSTYSTWWIRASIQDHVLRNWSIVRTGTTAAQKSLFFNLRRLKALIRDGAEPRLSPENRAEIARKLGVHVHEVEDMESRLAASDRSLNAAIGEDGDSEWQDLLADTRALPDEEVSVSHDGAVRHALVEQALKCLNPREHMIISKRRLTEDGMTLESLGRKLGVSKERVRQIESQALKKLKAALLSEMPNLADAGLLNA